MQKILVAVLVVLAIWGALFGWQYITVPDYSETGAMAHHYSSSPESFFLHMLFAPLSLFIGAYLVVPKVWHSEKIGPVLVFSYVISCGFAAIGSVELALNTKGTVEVLVGLLALLSLWVFVTIQLCVQMIKGDHAAARRWFIRSFALALASPVTRLLLLVYFMVPITDFQTAYAWVTWVGWVPNIVIAEWYLRRGTPS